MSIISFFPVAASFCASRTGGNRVVCLVRLRHGRTILLPKHRFESEIGIRNELEKGPSELNKVRGKRSSFWSFVFLILNLFRISSFGVCFGGQVHPAVTVTRYESSN
jgi:hypothetical protein